MESAAVERLVKAHFEYVQSGTLIPFLDLCEWRGQRKENSRSVPLPTDARWSADGSDLAVCARELVVVSRAKGKAAQAAIKNEVGEITFRVLHGEIRRKSPEPYVLSADFTSGARLITGWSDGTVQESSKARPLTHRLVTTLKHPVHRVRAFGDMLALATSEGSYLWKDEKLEPLGGSAARGTFLMLEADGIATSSETRIFAPGLAWSDSGRLALADTRGLLVHEGGVTKSLLDGEVHDVAFRGETLVAAGPTSLIVIEQDGTRRELRLEHSLGATTRITGFAVHGSMAAVSVMGGEESALLIIDLETGASSTVPSTALPRLGSSSPLAFAPTGDGLAIVSSQCAVKLVPWNGTYAPSNEDEIELRVKKLLRHDGSWSSLENWKTALAEVDLAALPAETRQAIERRNAEIMRRFQPAGRPADYKSASVAPPARIGTDEDDWSEGDRVKHPTLGEGVVEAVEMVGTATKLTVQFEGASRTLMSKFVQRA